MTTIAEVETWPEGAPVNGLAGRVAKAFEISNGTRPDGNPWVRQDFILNDGTQEIAVKWWDPGDREVHAGQYVEITSGRTGRGSKVSLHKGKRSITVNSSSLLFPQDKPQPATPQRSRQEGASPAPGKPTEVGFLTMLTKLVEGIRSAGSFGDWEATEGQMQSWVATGLIAYLDGRMVAAPPDAAAGPRPGGQLETGDDEDIPF